MSSLAPANAITITTLGTLGDLNNNGSGADEQAVLEAVARGWSETILADRIFTVHVGVGSGSSGGITGFDGQGFPVSGIATIASSVAGYPWWVDPTPEDHSEFTQDAEYSFLYTRGLEGPFLDLYSTLNHEFGHALFMHASPDSFWFNRRYLGLVSQENGVAFLNLHSRRVPLAGNSNANGYSHFAPVGFLGKGRTLMDAPRLLNDGGIVRTLIDPIVAEAGNMVHGYEFNEPPTAVPEPRNFGLLSAGLLGVYLLRKR